ncbi:MAG: c-type cytochrome [Gemmatimonadales bacterium]|nr:c-type cytochrome [Gemmatimonadales bacterium]
MLVLIATGCGGERPAVSGVVDSAASGAATDTAAPVSRSVTASAAVPDTASQASRSAAGPSSRSTAPVSQDTSQRPTQTAAARPSSKPAAKPAAPAPPSAAADTQPTTTSQEASSTSPSPASPPADTQPTATAQPPAEAGGGASAETAPLRDDYHQAPKDTVSQVVYDGWKQYNLNCARCHGEDALGTTIAPHLIVSMKPNGPINTQESFVQVVCAGRPARGMPSWCSLGLEMDKINAIYSYVKGRSAGEIGPGRPAVGQGG